MVSLDLFVCGPISLHYKSRLWYWGGRIALLSSSLPVASYFNRNPQSFGALIGYWVRFRNYLRFLCTYWSHPSRSTGFTTMDSSTGWLPIVIST